MTHVVRRVVVFVVKMISIVSTFYLPTYKLMISFTSSNVFFHLNMCVYVSLSFSGLHNTS